MIDKKKSSHKRIERWKLYRFQGFGSINNPELGEKLLVKSVPVVKDNKEQMKRKMLLHI